MSDILDEIGGHLVTEGLVDGTSEWKLSLGVVPPAPDKVVALFESPGEPPEGKYPLEHPALQVLVRGAEYGYEAARAHLRLIYNALHRQTGLTLAGTLYVHILALGSVLPNGMDEQKRPVITQNFKLSREE